MANKLDLGGIVDSLKQVINPAGGTPDVDPNDALGVKLASISVKVQELMQAQTEVTKGLAEVNQLLNGIYADIEAIRKPTVKADEGAEPATEAAPTESASTEAPSAETDASTAGESASDASAEGGEEQEHKD